MHTAQPGTDLDALLAQVQSEPANQHALLVLADYFLAAGCTPAERHQIRAGLNSEAIQLAYESLYFDGVGMEAPEQFLQRTLAALFMTGGFSHRETAQRILGELRLFADHHNLDFEAQYRAIRDLLGARRREGSRRRFILLNGGLLLALLFGIILLGQVPDTWRIPLQIALFVGLVSAQMALLYRYLS